MSDNPRDDSLSDLPEPIAERVIARAIALDTDAQSRVPLERLRTIAREVGISDEALEQALTEALHGTATVPATAPVRTGYLARLGRRLMGRPHPEDAEAEPGFLTLRAALEGLATNLIAFAVFWVPSFMILVSARSVGLLSSGPLDTAALLGLTIGGVALARRLRARLTMWGLSVAGVGIAVDLMIQLNRGSDGSSFVGSTGLLLMLAGSLGAVVGVLLTRQRARDDIESDGEAPLVGGAQSDDPGRSGSAHPDGPFLRLGLSEG